MLLPSWPSTSAARTQLSLGDTRSVLETPAESGTLSQPTAVRLQLSAIKIRAGFMNTIHQSSTFSSTLYWGRTVFPEFMGLQAEEFLHSDIPILYEDNVSIGIFLDYFYLFSKGPWGFQADEILRLSF